LADEAHVSEQMRRLAVDHAIGQARLEGRELSPELLADFERYVRGEITSSRILDNLNARYVQSASPTATNSKRHKT
jgi:hypothetical protein